MLTPWWKAIPGRLEAELEALREARIEFDTNDYEKAGFVVIQVQAAVDGGMQRLTARYPDVFPYTRPEVYAPGLRLRHHQNPFQTNLCLLGRRSDNWTPQRSLAWLIKEQLPKTVVSGQSEEAEAVRDLEEHQAEPVTAFYVYVANSVCLIDGGWQIPDGLTGGAAIIAIREQPEALRAAVVALKDERGVRVIETSWNGALTGYQNIAARWVILDRPIVETDAAVFDRVLVTEHNALRRQPKSHGLDLILVGFPEEIGWRRIGLGWVLLVRQTQTAKLLLKGDKRYLVRVSRAGRTDMVARIPEAKALGSVRVAVFGVGCVGAPIALDLARAGVKDLTLIDHDFVEAGATVRWPFGLTTVGRSKVDVLAEFIGANYPFTHVTTHRHRVGAIPGKEDTRDAEILDSVLSAVDLAVDATAEFGIQRVLSDLALSRRVGYIGVHGTHGGYGGEVMRLRKGETGCWMCLALQRRDGSIPNPPSKDAPWRQPVGCESPTFEGASWDLTEMSLAASRFVADTVAQDGPHLDWDVGVLALRDSNGGRSIAPTWSTFKLPLHAECTHCASR